MPLQFYADQRRLTPIFIIYPTADRPPEAKMGLFSGITE
jgi:hypothetical protein